jgi:hypothetical protein
MLLRRQGRKRDEIGARTGIDQNAFADTVPTGKIAFEPFGESAGRKPEIEGAIDERHHVALVEYASGHRRCIVAANERALPVGGGKVFPRFLQHFGA